MAGSQIARSGITQRILSSTGAVAGALGDQTSMDIADGDAVSPLQPSGTQAWGQFFGARGRIDATENTAAATSDGRGLLTGVDTEIDGGWRTGVMLGYSTADVDSSDNRSSNTATTTHLGVYAGTQMGPVGLRAGASYAWHDINSSRSVAFGGLEDSLNADYSASTAQAFAEIGYAFDLQSATIEPFAGIAAIQQNTDSFTENGGPAALTSASTTDLIGLTTLGMRGETTFADINGVTPSLFGAVAWQHAFGDIEPSSNLRFASGGNTFSVYGTPIDQNMALVEVGMSLEMDDSLSLNVAYQGEFGEFTRYNAGSVGLLYRF
jgi:outer membrane autotransporter protein